MGTCVAPGAWPATHSPDSRTSSSVASGGSCATDTPGTPVRSPSSHARASHLRERTTAPGHRAGRRPLRATRSVRDRLLRARPGEGADLHLGELALLDRLLAPDVRADDAQEERE